MVKVFQVLSRIPLNVLAEQVVVVDIFDRVVKLRKRVAEERASLLMFSSHLLQVLIDTMKQVSLNL